MSHIATLAGGCYWCFEALYQRLNGVIKVESGYSGGHYEHPSADDIYTKDTGHAECVQITYDPDIVSYRELLEIFFTFHDPTTLNRQGNDVGTIYRSVIFYHDEDQQAVAEDMLTTFAPKLWDGDIVTELRPFDTFWPADEYMQDYFNRNPNAGYCMVIINPKVEKFRKQYAAKLKPSR